MFLLQISKNTEMINSHPTCTLLDALIRTCRQVKYKFTKITIYENYFFCPKIWRSGGESRIFAIGIY